MFECHITFKPNFVSVEEFLTEYDRPEEGMKAQIWSCPGTADQWIVTKNIQNSNSTWVESIRGPIIRRKAEVIMRLGPSIYHEVHIDVYIRKHGPDFEKFKAQCANLDFHLSENLLSNNPYKMVATYRSGWVENVTYKANQFIEKLGNYCSIGDIQKESCLNDTNPDLDSGWID